MKLRHAALLLILAVLTHHPASAQDGGPEFESESLIEYGSRISLTATLRQVDQPLRAVVYLRPSSNDSTLVLEAEISSDPDVYTLEAVVNMRPAEFNPFEVLTVWWHIEFASGTSWSSPPELIRYEDTRFPWQERSDDQIHIHWVNGDAAFGERIYELTTRAIGAISGSLGLAPPAELAVYLYPSKGDLQTALQLGGAPWIEGHTLPELGVILLSTSAGSEAMIGLERAIPHELTHLLLYERLGESYSNLPAWLGEGLSTLQEQQPNPAYRFELERAVEENALLRMESLCSSFPITEGDALLAYAQSASFTQYLLDVYGMGGILQLLDAFQEGASCTGGIQRIYQRPLTQLEQEWKTLHLQASTPWERIIPILPWSLLLLLVGILILIGLSARQQASPP